MGGSPRPRSSGPSGLVAQQPVNYRDIQRAITALFRTGQFDDVARRAAAPRGDGSFCVIKVKERPILEKWAVRGVDQGGRGRGQGPGQARPRGGRSTATPSSSARAVASTRSTSTRATTAAQVKTIELPQGNGARPRGLRRATRAAASPSARWSSTATSASPTRRSSKHMATRPEGFWWFQKGEYDERKVDQDVRERLPRWYADNGYVDFQVHARFAGGRFGRRQGGAAPDGRRGTALPRSAPSTSRATAASRPRSCRRSIPSARSGTERRRRVGGGRAAVQPLATGTRPPRRCRTSTPTTATSTPRSSPSRSGAPGPTASRWWTSRWTIREGSPATINKIEIVGNDVTHERVIREAIVLLPGRSVQPGAADPLVPERLQSRVLPAAAAAPGREAGGQRRGRRRHRSGSRSAGPATSTSARRSGRAPASAASWASRSRTCSAGASAAGCSGSSARTSTTSR